MSHKTRIARLRANSNAKNRPRPLPAPVITHTWPSTLFSRGRINHLPPASTNDQIILKVTTKNSVTIFMMCACRWASTRWTKLTNYSDIQIKQQRQKSNCRCAQRKTPSSSKQNPDPSASTKGWNLPIPVWFRGSLNMIELTWLHNFPRVCPPAMQSSHNFCVISICIVTSLSTSRHNVF